MSNISTIFAQAPSVRGIWSTSLSVPSRRWTSANVSLGACCGRIDPSPVLSERKLSLILDKDILLTFSIAAAAARFQPRSDLRRPVTQAARLGAIAKLVASVSHDSMLGLIYGWKGKEDGGV
jgi:hypothetical protein